MLTQECGGVCVAWESGAFLQEVGSWLGTERALFSPTRQVPSPLQGNYRSTGCHYSVSSLCQRSIVRCCCPVSLSILGHRVDHGLASLCCVLYVLPVEGWGGGSRDEPAHSLDGKWKPDQVGADPSWKPETVTVLLP